MEIVMEKSKKKKIIIASIFVFVGTEIALYFLHPVVPLLVLLSLAIQFPIIWGLFKAKTGTSYAQRWQERKYQFQQDNDVEKWLLQEQLETKNIGYEYWSAKSKSLCFLQQAELWLLLNKPVEARECLAKVIPGKLNAKDKQRAQTAVKQLE